MDKTLLEVHSSCETTKQLISSLKDLPNHQRKLQSHLNSKLNGKNFHQVLQGCQYKKDIARVISCGGPTAGCCLDAIPSLQDYTSSNVEFCMAFLLRLCASLPALRAIESCIAQCGEPIDNFGYRLLASKWGGGAIHRHDRILDSVHQMLSSVGLRCWKELTEEFESKQRPDIAVYDFNNGKKLLLDITIAHHWAQNYIGRCCTTAGFAAAERDRFKNNKYLQMSTILIGSIWSFWKVSKRDTEASVKISSTVSRILTRRVSKRVATPSVGLFTKWQCKDTVQQGRYHHRKTAAIKAKHL